MKKSALLKVFLSIILAVLAGWAAGPGGEVWGVKYVQVFDLIGRLFLNALTLVVVPLVSASIITGAARMGAEESFASLGGKTFAYFLSTTFIAALVGFAAVTWIAPGIHEASLTPAVINGLSLEGMQSVSNEGGFAKMEQILLRLIPSNILAAASQGQMLGLIIFCLVFGYFISKIDSQAGSAMLGFWKAVFQIMMKITHLVLKALPIGVFGLVAKVAATAGMESFKSIGWYTLTVLGAMAFHLLVVLPLLLRVLGRVSPAAHIRAVWPAILTAFSTSSSAATLPVAIDCMEKRARVSNRICSFTVPLGASVNMQGTALFECVVALFIAQAYGIELSLASKCIIVLLSVLTSLGMAGIPSASVVVLVVTLQTVGIPEEGVALILPIERIVDMFRTVVNVFGNTCCAVLIARSEGETDVLAPVKAQQPIPTV